MSNVLDQALFILTVNTITKSIYIVNSEFSFILMQNTDLQQITNSYHHILSDKIVSVIPLI